MFRTLSLLPRSFPSDVQVAETGAAIHSLYIALASPTRTLQSRHEYSSNSVSCIRTVSLGNFVMLTVLRRSIIML